MKNRESVAVSIYNPRNITEIVREAGYMGEIKDYHEFYVVGESANETDNWWSVSITRTSVNLVNSGDEVIWLNYLSRADWMNLLNRLTEINNDE